MRKTADNSVRQALVPEKPGGVAVGKFLSLLRLPIPALRQRLGSQPAAFTDPGTGSCCGCSNARRLGKVKAMGLWNCAASVRPKLNRRGPYALGFTLIELMVVLVIIGVLAALIVPNVLQRADDARVTAARTDIGNIMQALKLYKLDNQRYPTAEQGLQALVARPTVPPVPPNWKPYLDKLPSDPWGHPYQYLNPGVKDEVDVISYGADGRPGGEGANADIGSWQ